MIYFIRHGKPDYSFIQEDMNCQWSNLAPLSEKGKLQALELRNQIDLNGKIILSSPYTRAFQTASILANGKDIIVEPLLHEWLPSKDFSNTVSEFETINLAFLKDKNTFNYETREEMIKRMDTVLSKYDKKQDLIVVCHSRLIETYLNIRHINFCEIIKYNP